MHHDADKFPDYRDAPREAVSAIFAPRSGSTLVSLAKLFRGADGPVGNAGPVAATRARADAVASKAAQVRGGIRRKDQHGRDCACCHPRSGRGHKAYRRAAGKAIAD